MAIRDLSRRLAARRGPTTEVGAWRPDWSLPLLIVGLLALLLAAYSVRPDVDVDLGTRLDAPYLDPQGFHAREFSPIDPSRAYNWPAGSDELVISEGLNPAFRMATITLDPWDNPRRRLVAVYANGDRIDTLDDRGGARDFRVPLSADVVSGRQLVLRVEPIPDRDSTELPPVQAVAARLSGATTYRWTTDRATVTFPSLGSGSWLAQLRVAAAHPDKGVVGARLFANGVPLADLPDYGALRRIAVLIPAEVVGNGDLTLTITANTYNDPRPLGLLIERVTLTPAGPAPGLPLPPLSLLLPALAATLSLYGSLRWLDVRPWLAAGAGFAAALLLAWALVEHRFPMAFFLPPLAWLLIGTALLTPLLDWGAARVFRAAGVELPVWLRRTLVLICVVGFWLKAGGLVFPYMRAIDISWHMDWTRRLMDGRVTFGAIFGTSSPLNELTMPVNEWGAQRPVIPYSPFFQLFALVFSVFPWPLETSANLLSALLDNCRVFLIAMLALKSGMSQRVALLAALLYAVTPVTFLLHAWGNIPTTFGIWWTLVATTIIVVLYDRLHQRGPFLLLTAVTLCCMLFYTVMAVFHVLFVLLFALIVLLLRKQIDTRPLRPMLLASGLAFGLSLLIYYGQYIPPVIERTLPYMLGVFTQGSESIGVERPSFGQYMWAYVPHLDYHIWPGDYLYYGLAIPIALVVPGFVALWKRSLLWAAMSAWFTIALLFMVAGTRISMVDKQLFYIVPPICLCAAVYLDRLWQRGRWGRLLVIGLYAFTLVSAISLWLIRIGRAPVS
ncbi:MAG: hypothetical protein OHK0022_23400 [Roseiflexaceae bacterium]